MVSFRRIRAALRAMARLALASLLALLLAGCGGGSDSPARDDLTRNRRLWQSRSVSSYRYTLQVTAFLAPEATGPVRIEVKDGKTVSIQPVASDLTIRREAFESYRTIDKLFDFLETSCSQKPASMTTKFDSANGYPTSAFIDRAMLLADDEIGFTVTDFTPLRNPVEN